MHTLYIDLLLLLLDELFVLSTETHLCVCVCV